MTLISLVPQYISLKQISLSVRKWLLRNCLTLFFLIFYYLHLLFYPLSFPVSPLFDYKHATSYPCVCVSLKGLEAAGGFSWNLVQTSRHYRGPGSAVGIATGYGLEGPGIESRWGARFSAPVQTGPGAHLFSCTMGTGSLPGTERPGRDADPSPLLVPWSRKSRAIPLLPLWAVRPVQSLSACTKVHFTFLLYAIIDRTFNS